MGKTIKFKYNNTDYVLEYNRMAIKYMEKEGFNAEKFAEQPMTMVDLAFEGAFIKNHSRITKAEVQEIFSLFKDKRNLINQLIIMIQETYSTLFDDTESDNEDESKKIEWKMD